MKRLLVTVGIPTYRRLEYLKEAVASARQQTYDNIEILIGDDGGLESIGAWVREAARSDPRIRYQLNPRRLGLAGNWNALADSARGELIAIIGDDDRLLPEFVKTLVERGGDAEVIFSNHYLIDASGRRLEEETRAVTHRYGRDRLSAGGVRGAEACVWRNSVPMSASLVRTREVVALRFKEDLNTPEIEFFARLAAKGGRFHFVPENLAEYRVHPRSETTAGLMSERLVKYLEPIPVRPEAEPTKREFMERVLSDAVGRLLLQNRIAEARALVSNRYYPLSGPRSGRIAAQWISTRMPGPWGGALYRALHRWAKRTKRSSQQ